MIPGPRNLVFADRFFSILESLGFFVLTWFSPFKNKNKSKWRLQSKTVPPLGRIFQNSKINPHFVFTFFLPFKSESRRSVDRVESTVGFYRRFIRDFSKIARPLCKFLEKDTKFNFDESCHNCFEEIKSKLVEAPIMAKPNWNREFEIMCDASDFAMGVVLGQKA